MDLSACAPNAPSATARKQSAAAMRINTIIFFAIYSGLSFQRKSSFNLSTSGSESGRKLPHSKSWRMFDAASQFAKGFGVRRPSGALETDPGDATYGEERKSARRFRAAYI